MKHPPKDLFPMKIAARKLAKLQPNVTVSKSQSRNLLFGALLAGAFLGLTLSTTANAHPHMWIDAKVNLQFDAQGQLVAVGQQWQFDEMFSSYARQGLPINAAPAALQAELDKIGKQWMGALADPMSHYFTAISQGNTRLAVGDPRGVRVNWDSKTERLSLNFELPLLDPVGAQKAPITVSVVDPTYFVAYSFEAPDAVSAPTAPTACKASYLPPATLDNTTAQRLAALPPDQGQLPPDLARVAQTLEHRIELKCP